MKVTQKKDGTGGVMSWGEEDWLAGLVPYFQNVNFSINQLNLDGMTWSTGMDPYFMPGSLWPGRRFTGTTNVSVVDAVQRNAVTNGSQAYSVGGTKMHNFGALTGVVANNATFPHTTTHSAHSSLLLDDIITYYIGTTKYCFYSFNDATDADIGRYDLSTTFDDDYMSTVPSGAALLDNKTVPHPMVVGDDDCLYIADGRNLHRYDGQNGADGTLSKNKLQLPLGTVITSYAKTGNYLIIYTYRPSTTSGEYYKSDVIAYFWDYVSEDPTYKYTIEGNYINGGFSFKGQPGCFVQGVDPSFKSQRESKAFLFNGTGFEELCSFPEDIPVHGGVQCVGNVIRWNSEGQMYQYGSLFGFKNALNRICVCAGLQPGGMLKNLAINTWFMSAGTGTDGGLNWTGAGGFYTDSQVFSGFTLPPFPIGFRGRVTAIKMYWRSKKVSSGSGASFYLMYEPTGANANASLQITDGTAAGTGRLIDEFFHTYNGTNLPVFSALGWQLIYGNGNGTDQPDVIQRIEIHYEHTKI